MWVEQLTAPAAPSRSSLGVPLNGPPPVTKLVKMWDEPPMDESVKALLSLMRNLDVWWDPMARNWQFCRREVRWASGVIHASVPHDGSLRRWQHELSQLGPEKPPEW